MKGLGIVNWLSLDDDDVDIWFDPDTGEMQVKIPRLPSKEIDQMNTWMKKALKELIGGSA